VAYYLGIDSEKLSAPRSLPAFGRFITSLKGCPNEPQRAPTAAADLGGTEDLLSPCPLGGCLSHTQMLKRSRRKAF